MAEECDQAVVRMKVQLLVSTGEERRDFVRTVSFVSIRTERTENIIWNNFIYRHIIAGGWGEREEHAMNCGRGRTKKINFRDINASCGALRISGEM